MGVRHPINSVRHPEALEGSCELGGCIPLLRFFARKLTALLRMTVMGVTERIREFTNL